MNIYIPMTRDRLRLLTEHPNLTVYDHETNQQMPLPVGSIVSFDRIDITKYSKPDHKLALSVRVVPGRMDLTMKKYGGKASFGVTARVEIKDLRYIDMEVVEGMP